MAFIALSNVTKEFSIQTGKKTERFRAIQNVSLSIERGEFVAVVGRSGSGKSTILNLIAGLIRPDGGSVFYDGKYVSRVNNNVGYMTQRDNLVPWRTVR